VTRSLRILSVVLVVAGITVLADVATTLAWREPVSSVYATIKQSDASDQLADLEREFPTPADLRRADAARGQRGTAAILARLAARRTGYGDPIGRIEIPAIGLDMVVVEGTDTASLERGPGHYSATGLPGQPGTVAIAGHRTTYLAPFRHLDQLVRGDAITLRMPYGTFTYTVQRKRIVAPSDVHVIHDTSYQRLVLTACNPLYSAAERIAVLARLARVSDVASG
jgi:sortase A